MNLEQITISAFLDELDKLAKKNKVYDQEIVFEWENQIHRIYLEELLKSSKIKVNRIKKEPVAKYVPVLRMWAGDSKKSSKKLNRLIKGTDKSKRGKFEHKRVLHADLNHPILVLKGSDFILDGYHRVAKAVKYKKPTIPVRFISRYDLFKLTEKLDKHPVYKTEPLKQGTVFYV